MTTKRHKFVIEKVVLYETKQNVVPFYFTLEEGEDIDTINT